MEFEIPNEVRALFPDGSVLTTNSGNFYRNGITVLVNGVEVGEVTDTAIEDADGAWPMACRRTFECIWPGCKHAVIRPPDRYLLQVKIRTGATSWGVFSLCESHSEPFDWSDEIEAKFFAEAKTKGLV